MRRSRTRATLRQALFQRAHLEISPDDRADFCKLSMPRLCGNPSASYALVSAAGLSPPWQEKGLTGAEIDTADNPASENHKTATEPSVIRSENLSARFLQ